MKQLLFYFRKYKTESILAPLFKMLESCFDLFVPVVVAKLIDVGINQRDTSYIYTCFGILILMAALGFGCCIVAQFYAAKAATGTASDLRHRLLEKTQSFSTEQLDKIGPSTLITRMTADVNQVQNGINMFLRLFLRSPFIVFGALIMVFILSPQLFWIFLVAVVLLFIMVFGIMYITRPMYRRMQEGSDNITKETLENLNGVRVIRAFGREKTQIEHFDQKNTLLYKAQKLAGNVSSMLNPLTYVIVNCVIIGVLWFGAKYVDSGILLSGIIIALINYIGQILIELVKLANLIVLLTRSSVSLTRISEILDKESQKTAKGDFTGENMPLSVEFKKVSLRYNPESERALSDVSFVANKGETIGIIGGTGSGKSSLIKLISGTYLPTEGEVLVKNCPTDKWDSSALCSLISSVEQNPLLFSGTVKSNLLWGKEDATDEDMWHFLEIARAHEFVKEEGGLDCVVDQGGTNFSGGQKQRLAIARALIKQGEILILDDSSSALDYATDKALRRGISEISKDGITFIVSQRASTIAHADKILVMDEGRLCDVGSHNDLLSRCAVYQEIYSSQNREDLENEE